MKFFYFYTLLFALFFSTLSAEGLQLNTGSGAVSNENRIILNNLQFNDQFYNAEIQLNLDGSYSIHHVELSNASPTSTYTVTFNSQWSESTFPFLFPNGSAHFSGLIGVTHNSTTRIWQIGQEASAGIENMAETGSKSLLTNEINVLLSHGDAGQLLSGGGIGSSPGSVELSFQAQRSHPFVSLVSMIAPSPDWFIGISALNLMRDGQWLEEITVPLFAYDAGTDSGIHYTSANMGTSPQTTITRLQELPFIVDTEIRPLGSFTFKRMPE